MATKTTRAQDAYLERVNSLATGEILLGRNMSRVANTVLNHIPTGALLTGSKGGGIGYGEPDEVDVRTIIHTLASVADHYSDALIEIQRLQQEAWEHQRDLEAVRRVFGTAVQA